MSVIRNYNEIYQDTRRRLREAGIEAGGLEARLLLAHAADKRPEELMRDIRMYPAGDFLSRAEELIRRRLQGEPAAYIVGSWSFMGLELEINRNVLIPRSDTELAAEAAIRYLRDRESPRVLDLCTGSGCIGISIAANVPDCRVVLADLDRRALMLAKRNALRCHVSGRTLCLEADVNAPPPPRLGLFSLVVSNPPYIPSGEIPGLDPSVRDYEPHLALDGGEDGLVFYRSIFARWLGVLEPDGILVLECGEGQSDPLRRMGADSGLEPLDTITDSLGTERTLVFRHPGHAEGNQENRTDLE